MTTLLYMYYVAKEWVDRTWDYLSRLAARTPPVAYVQGRVSMSTVTPPEEHRGADEGYADELRQAQDEMQDTGEIWLIDGGIEIHNALADMQRTSLAEFNARFEEILAGFEYDTSIDNDKNPMAPAARAEMIPWREEIADQFRTLADQVQHDCREEVLTW